MNNPDSRAQVRYEMPAPAVARIVLDRPEKRNAQGKAMTFALDDAFRRACHDDDVRVIILAAAGEVFSAGHDIDPADAAMPTAADSRGWWGQYGGPAWEGWYAREKELYLEAAERMRNAPKPTIAQVQGACISGGVMLAWACDLIICADDARFRDNTAAEMAVPGVEMFVHALELGPRKAKEWLFTGDWLSAEAAERRGMVNHVVPRAELEAFTLALAERVAQTDRFVLKLAKEAINNAEDAAGRRQGLNFGFALHQIGHLQNMLRHGHFIDISRLPAKVREAIRRAAEETDRST